MAQKEFKKANFAKLFNYNVFFGDYLQYISWSVKNSKTLDMLTSEVSKKVLHISVAQGAAKLQAVKDGSP